MYVCNVMYDICYDYVKPKYIKRKNFYIDIVKEVETRFDTSN